MLGPDVAAGFGQRCSVEHRGHLCPCDGNNPSANGRCVQVLEHHRLALGKERREYPVGHYGHDVDPGLITHPFDEFVLFIGSNTQDLQDFGGEIEFTIGEGDDAEVHIIDTTCAVFFPAGLPHGPIVYKRVDKPHIMIVMGLETDDYY